MRVAFGSDQKTPVTDVIDGWLQARGHVVEHIGALREGDDDAWPSVGRAVGSAVAEKRCDTGIVCCWTGTGVSIAANKITGVRAALCTDAGTAAGAREWNDANVLAIGLRQTSGAVAEELLTAWFSAAVTADPVYGAMIASVEFSRSE